MSAAGTARRGVLHILGLDCLPATGADDGAVQRCTPVAIGKSAYRHQGGYTARAGVAVLAHPAWSPNTPEQFYQLGAYEATEIYNSVSAWGMSDRPYSGV